MNYLLDSNTISDFYDKNSPDHLAIAEHLSKLNDEDEVFISIISLYELEYGFNNAPENKKPIIRKKIEEIKKDFTVLPLSEKGSIRFGKLKKSLVNMRRLKKQNAKKHNIDIILASTAILNSCILISADKIYLDMKRDESELETNNWAN